MKNQYRILLIHSLLIFVLVFMLNTLIHEGGHALMAKALGLHPVLHHNYVSNSSDESTTLTTKILVPAAGPLVSLLQGIIFFILIRVKKNKSLLTLFFLWMSIMGLINFGGYLMMTPIFDYGDTGKVLSLLEASEWVKWLVAIGGLLLLLKMMQVFTLDFENQAAPPDETSQTDRHRKTGNALIAYPVMIGCVITSLISLPVPTFLSILYPATSPFITFMSYGRLKRRKASLSGKVDYPKKISLTLIIFVIILFTITRLLVPGVAI